MTSLAYSEDRVAAANGDLLADTDCLTRLDTAAAWIGRDDNIARSSLQQLLEQCPDLPQVHHDLAVVDARARNWDQAISRLERAIELDTRAAGSVGALRDIHRWRAAQAYAKALDGTPKGRAPELVVQNSRDVNSDTRRFQRREPTLFDEATVDYELWEWWRTASVDPGDEHLSHYTDAAIADNALFRETSDDLPEWTDVERKIRFVGREAVALVSWSSVSQTDDTDATDDATETDAAGLLLLMKLQNDRWRIYEELPLP